MSSIGPGFVAVLTAIIGLAMVAVIVSKGAQTGQVLTSGGNALAKVIGAAVQPVTSNSNLLGSVGVNIGGLNS